jgi:hypothetical protein
MNIPLKRNLSSFNQALMGRSMILHETEHT